MQKLISCLVFFVTLTAVSQTYAGFLITKTGKLSINEYLKQKDKFPTTENPKRLSAEPYALCSEIDISTYIPNYNKETYMPVFGCTFSDQVAMNASLLRSGIYIHTPMGMVTDQQLFDSKLMTAVGGHDFLGEDLKKYIDTGNFVLPNPDYAELLSLEQKFWEEIIYPIVEEYQDKFILFAVMNFKTLKQNFSHELLHAQYYNSKQVQDTIKQTWNSKVSAEDKHIIKDALEAGGYDVQQEELLYREFYSYYMQYDAKNYLESISVLKPMAELTERYVPAITMACKQSSFDAIAIND